MTWFQKTRYLPLKAFFCREFRNLKPLRPTESSPTRLAVTKVWHLKWLTVLHYYWSDVVSQHPSMKAYFWIMCNIAWLNISCRRPPWEWPGPWPRVTKRSTGGFTGSTFHFDFALQSFLFQGLFMRELKELTAVSDSHLLVGFLLLEFIRHISFLTFFTSFS